MTIHFSLEDLKRIAAAGPANLEFTGNECDRGLQRALQTVLIKQTLDVAEESIDGYRTLYERAGICSGDFQKLTDLARFPVIHRADLVADIGRFISPISRPEHIRSTSGSTGKRLTIYGCAAEMDAHRALFDALNGEMTDPLLVLRISPPVRRLHSQPLTSPKVVNLSITYIPEQLPGLWLTHTDFVHQTLSEGYFIGDAVRRITALHITPPYFLELLTANLHATGIDPRSYGVGTIVLTGGHATLRHRRICEAAWGARCVTTFSCTEVLASFPEVHAASGVYAPSMAAYAEVVDLETGLPVIAGSPGGLVLTATYPFQQTIPLIRYQPGDTVRAVDLPDGRRGFKVIGRSHECISLANGEVVGPTEILDILSIFDKIPQIPAPRFQLTQDRIGGENRLRMDVEANAVTATQRSTLEDAIAHAFASEVSGCVNSAPVIRVHPKGSLSSYLRLYPES